MTRFTVDPDAVRNESRLVTLEVGISMLRLIGIYQEVFGPDPNRLMIVIAVGAITTERPVRDPNAPEHFARFGVPIPSADMARCTALAVSAATGLPRETTRRKIRQMIDDGLLIRDEPVGVRINPDIVQRPEFQVIVRRHAGEIARLTNALLDRGVLVQAQA